MKNESEQGGLQETGRWQDYKQSHDPEVGLWESSHISYLTFKSLVQLRRTMDTGEEQWNLKAWIYNRRKFLLMWENLHLKSCILTRLTASFNITDSFTPKSKIICRNLKNIPKEIRFFLKYFNKYIKWTLQKPCLVSRMRNVHVGGSTEKKTASGYNPVLHHIALYVALAMSHSDPPVHPSSTCFYLFFFFFFRFFKSNPWSPPTMFSGVVMLDREEPSLSSIMEKIVDEMVEKEEIRPVDREGVFKALTQNRR